MFLFKLLYVYMVFVVVVFFGEEEKGWDSGKYVALL